MTKIYKRHPQLAGRVVEELAFVVTANDNKLHTLNSTGTRIWELCAEPKPVTELARQIADEFEVSYEAALIDVESCMNDFVEREILIAHDE